MIFWIELNSTESLDCYTALSVALQTGIRNLSRSGFVAHPNGEVGKRVR